MFHTYYTCIKDIKKTTTAFNIKFKFFTKIKAFPDSSWFWIHLPVLQVPINLCSPALSAIFLYVTPPPFPISFLPKCLKIQLWYSLLWHGGIFIQ